MFAEIAEKKGGFKPLYEQFDKCSKLGVHEDSAHRTKLAEPLRSHTSKFGDEQISLTQYVDRMKEGQKEVSRSIVFHIFGFSLDVSRRAGVSLACLMFGRELPCRFFPWVSTLSLGSDIPQAVARGPS